MKKSQILPTRFRDEPSFIKDTVTGITTRISTDSAGNQASGGTLPSHSHLSR